MQEDKKTRKTWLWGVIAVIAILIVVGILLVMHPFSGQPGETQGGDPIELPEEFETLYWNLDRELYSGNTESGASSRTAGSDGLFYIRFFVNGENIELKTAEKKLVNAIDELELMGLAFDENGLIVGVIRVQDMPLQRLGWQCFVQSAGRSKIKVNSSSTFSGVSQEIKLADDCVIYDMTGTAGEPGSITALEQMDRIYAFANTDGEACLIYIYFRGLYANTVIAECRHCEEEVRWTKWTSVDTLPKDTGHYLLTNDVNLSAQFSSNENTQICLDLNGKTVTGAAGKRVYALFEHNCELNIMDSSPEQTGSLKAIGESTNEGGVLWIRYADGTLNLYQGILDGSGYTVLTTAVEANGKTDYVFKHGAAVSTAGTFNMYGGTLLGGTAYRPSDYPADKASNGGALAVIGKNSTGTQNGIFNMYGGEILGGSANAGGNVIVYGVMNMSGGRIAEGQTINAKGDRTGTSENANVFVVNGLLNMSGGVIAGGVNIRDTAADDGQRAEIRLSGTANISGAKTGAPNLTVNQTAGDGALVTLGELSEGAQVGVTARGIFTEKTSAKNRGYFFSDLSTAQVCYYDSALAIGRLGCLCGGEEHRGDCDGKTQLWLPWLNTEQLPIQSGYYYLTGNVVLNSQQGIVAVNGAAQNVHLDLNGKTVTGANAKRVYALFDEKCTLTVSDSSKEQTGSLKAVGTSANPGGVVWVRYASNTFTLYGGTLDGSDYTSLTSMSGTNYVTNHGATVNTAGAFTMYGGTLLGGKAELPAGYPADKASNGGAVAVLPGGVFALHDGEILGGSANAGGNVIVYGVMNMSGGRIAEGRTINAEGDRTGDSENANVFVVNGLLNMSGGVIAGGVNIRDTAADDGQRAEIRLSGTANISGAKVGAPNLTVNQTAGDGALVTLGKLSEGAQIGVTASGIFTGKTSENNCNYFFSDLSAAQVCYYDGALAIGKLGCLCGNESHKGDCDGTALLWQPWKNTDQLPVKSGNYYLTGNVVLNSQQGIVAVNGAAQNVHLDLNGKTVTGANAKRVYALFDEKCTLTVSDSSKEQTGSLKAVGISANPGGVVWVRHASNSFTLYGGTLDGSEYTCQTGMSGTNYVASHGATVNTAGTFTMYGGTLLGGKAELPAGYPADKASNGGAVAVLPGGVFALHDGEILGGSANAGGNVMVYGTMIVSGGTITGGTANYGKNVYLNNAEFVISGGTITGGVEAAGTTGVKLSGDAKIIGDSTNLKLSANAVITVVAPLTVGEQANVGITAAVNQIIAEAEGILFSEADVAFFSSDDEDCHIELQNGAMKLVSSKEILGCECGGKGDGIPGHIHEDVVWTEIAGDSNASANLLVGPGNYKLTGDLIIAGQTAFTGGTVRIDLNGHAITRKGGGRVFSGWSAKTPLTVIITDSSADGNGQIIATGTATSEGGCIALANNAKMTMFAGHLNARGYDMSSSTSSYGGAAVFINSGCSFTMYGGTVTGGKAVRGGAVYAGGQFKLCGGTVTGGTATTSSGGNVFVNVTGTLLVEGNASIENGSAPSASGGNVMVSGTMEMRGGTVSGGSATYGGNVYLNSTTLTIDGGTIAGDVQAAGTSNVKLSGDAKIIGGSANLRLSANAVVMVVGPLTVGTEANVGITGTVGRVFAKGEGYTLTPKDAEFFTSDDASLEIVLQDSGLALVARSAVGNAPYAILKQAATELVKTALQLL